jgi:hypothetical protein
MTVRGSKTALLTTLLLILFGAAAPLRAQIEYHSATLDVCNKGTVPVEVVTARKNELFQVYYEVESTNIAAQHCERAYSNYASEPVYIAFGFADAKGQWGSGKIAKVPDFGTHAVFFRVVPVLTSSTKGICARKDQTHYVIENDIPADCANFMPAPMTIGLRTVGGVNVGHGPFLPLTAAVYFGPVGQTCSNLPGQGCSGGDYYLNISPSANDRELHAAVGTPSGADARIDPPVDPATALKQLDEALANLRKKYPAPEPAPAPQSRARMVPGEGSDPRITAALAEQEKEKWKSPIFPVSAYDPQWLGKTLVLRGTVARVEVEKDGFPMWAHIYFKESPDSTITACSPYPDMLQKMFGNNFSGLIGKTMEMAGQVEKFCAPKFSIRIVDPAQIRVVGAP